MSSLKVDDRGSRKASWHFVVSETVRHIRGHTLYRVTLQVIPVDVSETVKEIVWWKRYSDFQVLHKALSALHAALYLKGSFPAYPKPIILRRHEEQVIEERRQAAEKLLNFVSDYHILCRHDAMKDFLNDGEELTCTSDLDPTKVLRPQKLYLSDEFTDSIDDLLAENSSDAGQGRNSCISPATGIWQHRQDDRLSPDSPFSSPFPDSPTDPGHADLPPKSSFEPIHPINPEITATGPWDSVDDLLDDTAVMAPKSHHLVLSDDHSRLFDDITVMENGRSRVAAESGKGDGVLEEDYLFIAGHHLARANDKELAGEFEVSFGLYKLGIDILLRGVQNDKDPVRRDAVRRKAAKYLAKAEELYNDHVSGSLNDMVDSSIHSEYSTAAGIRAELAEYTIISVSDEKVSLVMHKSSRETLILKVLSKTPASSAGKRRDRRTIIPLGPQRHMVQLRRFIETDDSVYVILERAPGGRLVDYINKSAAPPPPDEKRGGMRKTDSASSEISRTSSNDFASSWKKLVMTVAASEEESASSDYADLFFKHAIDSDRSRTSSLAHIERPTFSTMTSLDWTRVEEDDGVTMMTSGKGHGDSTADWSADQLLESVDLTEVFTDNRRKESRNGPDITFLQSVEPSASPTLKGLSNWRNVSELDSDQLVAKSKELIQSLDMTIGSTESSQDDLIIPSQEIRSKTPSPFRPEISIPVPSDQPDLIAETRPALRDVVESDETVLKRMPETLVRVWAAEMIVAVEGLHELGVMCMDLDLHNVLLGEKGHIKLTYFSQWNSVIRTIKPSNLQCNCHIAPELQRVGEQPTSASDVWSVGIVIFHLLTGQKFAISNPVKMHTHRSLTFPPNLSPEATDLLQKVLKFSPRERLTLAEVRSHPWFKTIDWRRIQNSL